MAQSYNIDKKLAPRHYIFADTTYALYPCGKLYSVKHQMQYYTTRDGEQKSYLKSVETLRDTLPDGTRESFREFVRKEKRKNGDG